MTMQEKEEYKFKELHCDKCDKYMGFINAKHQSFPHDFFCTLKCLEDWKTKNKITDIKIERLKGKK